MVAVRGTGAPVPDDAGVGDPPEGEPFAAVRESHLSAVLLVGGLALKVKKPLQLPFVDLSTRAARDRNCHDELILNRRLAPDVYRDVVEVAGEPVLVMRRMPAARRLATVLDTWPRERLRAALDDIARLVARLHADEDPITGFDLLGSTRRLWAAGDEQMRTYADVVVPSAALARLSDRWQEYLDGRAGLLRSRDEAGLVRDGHGDLLADDVFCLDDGPRVLDCLEFDRSLRVNDVLADVAFLAMDLDLRGAGDLAHWFVDRYRDYAGERHPRSLEHHYVAYRAFVRAKVECLRAGQGDPAAADRARALLALAVRRLEAGRVRLLLVGGLPGSGKSTLAAAFAEGDPQREWAVLSSDAVRRDLVGGAASAGPRPFGADHYDAAHTEATYTELLRRAELALRAGECAVLDASWTDPRLRDRAADLACRCAVPLTAVRCVAPLDLCERRLITRLDPRGSDADAAVLHGLAARPGAGGWPDAVDVGTAGSLDSSLDIVRGLLAPADR